MVPSVTTEFDALRARHMNFVARAAAVNNQVGRDQRLLREIRAFIQELVQFQRKNSAKLTPAQQAQLIQIRDKWVDATEAYA